MGGKLGTPFERFQTKYRVSKKTGCWNWTASLSDTGYGYFYFPPKNMVSAHKAAWKLYRGSTKGLHVLHDCDNPRCVNPEHLKLGTHQDNMRDRDSRGRQYDRAGSKNGRAKINGKAVRSIRRDGRAPRFMILDYPEISFSTLQNIRHGRTWKHVP